MAIPTHLGDVLILRTDQTFTIYAVGLVTKNGQQDFHAQENVRYESNAVAAVALAKTMVVPGGRMFIRNLDVAAGARMDWLEFSK